MGSSRNTTPCVVRLRFHLPCRISDFPRLSAARVRLPLGTWTDCRLVARQSIEIDGQIISCLGVESLHIVASQHSTGGPILQHVGMRRFRRTDHIDADADELASTAAVEAELWAELDVQVRPHLHIYLSPSLRSSWRHLLTWVTASLRRADAPPLKISQFESILDDSTLQGRFDHQDDAETMAASKMKKKTPVHALEAVYASLRPRVVKTARGGVELPHPTPVGPGLGAHGLNSIPVAVIMKGEA